MKEAAERFGRELADDAPDGEAWTVAETRIASALVPGVRTLARESVPAGVPLWLVGVATAAIGVLLFPASSDVAWIFLLAAITVFAVAGALLFGRPGQIEANYERAYRWALAAALERIDQRLGLSASWDEAHFDHGLREERQARDARIAERKDQAASLGIPMAELDPPAPAHRGVSPREAEELVAQWMRSLGDVAARVTQYVGDGGVDVASERHIAQVKHYASAVRVADLRQLAGVAAVDGRRPLFFTSTGYASGAVSFARQAGIALFVYDAKRGTLTAVTEDAREIWTNGL